MYFIQYTTYPVMLMSNFRTNVMETVQKMLPSFAIFIIYPVYMVSPCSFSDSVPSHDILDLTKMLRIRRMLPMMHLKDPISVIISSLMTVSSF